MHRKTYSDWRIHICAAGHLDIDWLDDPDLIFNAADIMCLESLDELCLVTDGGRAYTEYVAREISVINAVFNEETGMLEGDLGYPLTLVPDPTEWWGMGKAGSRWRKSGGVKERFVLK